MQRGVGYFGVSTPSLGSLSSSREGCATCAKAARLVRGKPNAVSIPVDSSRPRTQMSQQANCERGWRDKPSPVSYKSASVSTHHVPQPTAARTMRATCSPRHQGAPLGELERPLIREPTPTRVLCPSTVCVEQLPTEWAGSVSERQRMWPVWRGARLERMGGGKYDGLKIRSAGPPLGAT